MGAQKQLDHEKFMNQKNIKSEDLPEELKEVDEVLRKEKKKDFEGANEASKMLLETLKDDVYKIKETLEDHEERIEDLEEKVEDLEEDIKDLNQDQEPKPSVEKSPIAPIGKDEGILAKLYDKKIYLVSRNTLKENGFTTGLFSKLSSRGGRYGGYELKKNTSDKMYKIIKIA